MVKQYIGEKLNNMNCENMIKMMEIMQEQVRKKETEEEQKFMNAMLIECFALAQRKCFWSSEKYADG